MGVGKVVSSHCAGSITPRGTYSTDGGRCSMCRQGSAAGTAYMWSCTYNPVHRCGIHPLFELQNCLR